MSALPDYRRPSFKQSTRGLLKALKAARAAGRQRRITYTDSPPDTTPAASTPGRFESPAGGPHRERVNV